MQALPNCSVVHQDDFFKVSVFAAGWAVRTAAALSFLVPGARYLRAESAAGLGRPPNSILRFCFVMAPLPAAAPTKRFFLIAVSASR